jgi:predicted amidohydrolase
MYGGSMITNPWGAVEASCTGAGEIAGGDELVFADLSKSTIGDVRERINLTASRRPECYVPPRLKGLFYKRD